MRLTRLAAASRPVSIQSRNEAWEDMSCTHHIGGGENILLYQEVGLVAGRRTPRRRQIPGPL